MAYVAQVAGFMVGILVSVWAGMVMLEWSWRGRQKDLLTTVVRILSTVRQISSRDLRDRLQRRGFDIDRSQLEAMMANLMTEGLVEIRPEIDSDNLKHPTNWYRLAHTADVRRLRA